MKEYFHIRYEFDSNRVHEAISNRLRQSGSDYICVADGVVLNTANRKRDYLNVVNGGMFSICDSSYVPLYIRWIDGTRYRQYCGSQIFMDIIRSRKYRMFFMGTSMAVLEGLRRNLIKENPDVVDMKFLELPYRMVNEFDYESIAKEIEEDGADIVWIALGAPKQEYFMNRLKPFLKKGVMIAVGAVFKFYSGMGTKRAPQWMVKRHLEFLYRIFMEPQKQLKRCGMILFMLPKMLAMEIICKLEHEKRN